MSDGWRVRAADPLDRVWMRDTLAAEMATNSYLYGVDKATHLRMAGQITFGEPVNGWKALVVSPADEPDERAGWVLYEDVPTLTVVFAFVEPSFRRLGAWRALREAIGLRDGMQVAVVLGSPRACSEARKRYAVKHNWGRIL